MTYTTKIPSGSLIAKALKRVDYEDAFAIHLKQNQSIAAAILPPLFFKSFPKWFMVLMHIRESIARGLGLKTADGADIKKQIKDFTGEPGQSIALFHVLGNNETEILSGENDSHLDFRLSFFSQPKEEGTEIILATAVQMNNWIGRLYFLPVRLVHRLIMPVILRRMEKLLDKRARRL